MRSQAITARRAILVVFDGMQSLDATGPAEVFATAARLSAKPLYEVILASDGGGLRKTSAGYAIETRPIASLRPTRRDTVLVCGGEEHSVRSAIGSAALRAWLARAEPSVERFGSVCSGAFVLAAAGLLDHKRAATHWAGCALLAKLRPQVTVDHEAIFVEDGRTWTSAGVTSGIDMALAMVERDHGRALVDEIAARLVLYARRPGFQSQWSEALVAQRSASTVVEPAVEWARTHLNSKLSVESLAKRAAMSVRTFHRRCASELGTTPARIVAQLRVERAKTLLSTTDLSIKQIASHCGLRDGAQLARLCRRALGVSPAEFRQRFAR
ncbi:MAG: helix-turn-helix domain-containing protein [Myxococcales bacterium]|nr:helix-turn-helix domain-containing protein [Myxococcales bacterium]